MSQTDEQKWDAGGSVHFEHRPHAEGGTRVAMLRHPNNPFRRIVGPTTRTAFDATAQAAANAYLQALAQANDLTRYATLLEQLFSTKITEHHMQLRWRPISWSSAGLIDPRDSFWVERYDDPQNSPNVRNFQDRTLVLLAVMHYRSSTATKEADLHPQRGGHGLKPTS